MDNKTRLLGSLGLCRKAGMLAVGAPLSETAVRQRKARLVLLTEDASANTAKKFKNQTTSHEVPLLVLFKKTELGYALGMDSVAVAAVTDEGFAKKIQELANTVNEN